MGARAYTGLIPVHQVIGVHEDTLHRLIVPTQDYVLHAHRTISKQASTSSVSTYERHRCHVVFPPDKYSTYCGLQVLNTWIW